MSDWLQEKCPERIFLFGVVLILSCCFISSDSLWLDEMCRVVPQMYGDWEATVHSAYQYAQPGYIFYMFGWIRLFGDSEFILRMANLPFVLLACFYAFRILDRNHWPSVWVLFFFCHPMFVYYMNEATPYVVLYGFSMMFLYYVLYGTPFDSWKNILLIHLSFLAGVLVHFLFGFIFLFYLCRVCWEKKRGALNLRRHIFGLLAFSTLYVPLLGIYLLGLGVGSGGSTRTGFGLKNILYIPYGFFGMAGLGLSRNDLRAGNFGMITGWQILFLGCALLLVLSVCVWLFCHWHSFFRENGFLICSAALFFAGIGTMSKLMDFGLWERHCSMIFPVYIILLLRLLVQTRTTSWKTVRGGMLALFGGLMLISMVNIRCNSYYGCDDHQGVYRFFRDYVKTHEDFTLYVDYLPERAYYDLAGLLPDTVKVVAYRIESLTVEEWLRRFESDREGVLVLFEKDVPKKQFCRYDGNRSFAMAARFNSFKIVRHAE